MNVWLTPEQADEMRAALADAARGPVKLLDPLPLRTRAKLSLQRHADAIGCWLCEHVSPEMAMRWWKIWRLWQ